MHEAQILRQAYHLLQEYGITRGAFARSASGDMCPTDAPNADKFCSVGAIFRASESFGMTYQEAEEARLVARKLIALAAELPSEKHVTEWNDASTDAEILYAFQTTLDIIDPPEAPSVVKEMVAA